jgi:hypothetical protein
MWQVYEDNIGKKADSRKWDNVHEEDKYFWREQSIDEFEQFQPKTQDGQERIADYIPIF